MKLYEYQAKDLFRRFRIPVPEGRYCVSPEEAGEAAVRIGTACAVKAQVLSGGRGKAGGIRFASTPAEVQQVSKDLLTLSVRGERPSGVLVEEMLPIVSEFYLSVIADPDARSPVILFCRRGGVDIEQLVAAYPGELLRIPVDPRYGFWTHRMRSALADGEVAGPWREGIISTAQRLYDLFWSIDAEVAEINPLVHLDDGRLLAADGKLAVDSSALYRHPELPRNDGTEREDRARKKGLAFVELDGEVGILSNGAGLTMATMDQLALAGARPANFLDCGARIIQEGVEDGLRLIVEDSKTKAILVNIFGGGVRCDVIADKLLAAVAELADEGVLRVPVVACLQGRNGEEGRGLLRDHPLPHLRTAESMDAAVRIAVRLAVGP